MRRVLLLPALLLVPSFALAQVTVTENGDQPDEIVNIAECRGDSGFASTIAIQWTLTSVNFSQVEVRVSDTSGCPASTSNSTAHTASLGTFTGTNNTTSLGASDLLGRIGIPSASCSTGANLPVQICVVPRDANGTDVSGSTITGTFLLDRTVPPTPTAPTVKAGDGALRVSWTAVSGSNLSYRVEATPQGVAGATPILSDEVTGTSVRLSNLTVGTAYDVVVIAISEGGNESAKSPPTAGTPVLVNDFWDLYRGAGGGEEGGCSTTGGASLALLAFVPFALRRRRS